MRNTFLLGLVLTAASAALVLAGDAISGAEESPGAPAAERIEPQAPRPVDAVEPTAKRALAVLETAPVSPVPEKVAEEVASPMRFGRNPKLARAILSATGPGWAVPGRGHLCIVVPDPGYGYATACGPTADIARKGLWIGLSGEDPSGKTKVTMLTPPGKRALRLANDQGVATGTLPRGAVPELD